MTATYDLVTTDGLQEYATAQVSSLYELANSPWLQIDGLQVHVASVVTDVGGLGSGVWQWSDAVSKTSANFGVLFDPAAINSWGGTAASTATTVYASGGQGSATGNGCWKRLGVRDRYECEWFAAPGGRLPLDDQSIQIQAAIDASGGVIRLPVGRTYLEYPIYGDFLDIVGHHAVSGSVLLKTTNNLPRIDLGVLDLTGGATRNLNQDAVIIISNRSYYHKISHISLQSVTGAAPVEFGIFCPYIIRSDLEFLDIGHSSSEAFNIGVEMDFGWKTTFSNLYIHAHKIGIYLPNLPNSAYNSMRFDQILVRGAVQYCLYAMGMEGFIVNNFYVGRVGGTPIYLNTSTGVMNSLFLENVDLPSKDDACLYLRNCQVSGSGLHTSDVVGVGSSATTRNFLLTNGDSTFIMSGFEGGGVKSFAGGMRFFNAHGSFIKIRSSVPPVIVDLPNIGNIYYESEVGTQEDEAFIQSVSLNSAALGDSVPIAALWNGAHGFYSLYVKVVYTETQNNKAGFARFLMAATVDGNGITIANKTLENVVSFGSALDLRFTTDTHNNFYRVILSDYTATFSSAMVSVSSNHRELGGLIINPQLLP